MFLKFLGIISQHYSYNLHDILIGFHFRIKREERYTNECEKIIHKKPTLI